jgi:hypothetical protein
MNQYRFNNLHKCNKNNFFGEKNTDGNTKEFAQVMRFANCKKCTIQGNQSMMILVSNAEKGCAPLIFKMAKYKDDKAKLQYQLPNIDMI